MDNLQALDQSKAAIGSVFNCDASVGETIALDAVSGLETTRGEGWKGAGVGSNNQGAIQCGSGWTGDRFVYKDTHPNSDGTSSTYTAYFRKYSTRLDGLKDLALVMYRNRGRSVVRDAARMEDWRGVSQRMHDTGYYEGFGPTVADRVNNHCRALMGWVNRDLKALEQQPVIRPAAVVPETVRLGDSPLNGKAAAVAELQRELRLAADGIFGRLTQRALLAYQAANGLIADGVCGPQTWQVLLSDDYIPSEAA